MKQTPDRTARLVQYLLRYGGGFFVRSQPQLRWLIHTDMWTGSRACCTTPDSVELQPELQPSDP